MSRLAASAALVLFLAAPAVRAEDSTPPLIRHTPLTKASKGEAVNISATMEDESEIFAPTLYFRYPGAKGYSSVAMSRKGEAFVASVQATADVEYWIEAYDEFGNGPTREGSPDRPHRIAVAEKAGSPRAARDSPRAAPAPRAAPRPAAAEPEAPPPPPEPEEEAAAPAEAPAAATTDVVPLLEEEPTTPIYKQWWFLAGGGVVVAAIVVGVVVAAQPDPVHQDVFSATVKRP